MSPALATLAPVLSLPQPVLCRDWDLLPIGGQWVYQLKIDGFFGLLANLGRQPSLTSRCLGQVPPDVTGESLHALS